MKTTIHTGKELDAIIDWFTSSQGTVGITWKPVHNTIHTLVSYEVTWQDDASYLAYWLYEGSGNTSVS